MTDQQKRPRRTLGAPPLWQRLTGGALAIAVLAIAALLTWNAIHETQDDIAERCLPALRERPAGDTSRPDECDGLTEENYTLLNLSVAIDESGVDDDLIGRDQVEVAWPVLP
ncbi:hypothetical protein [Streptomyces sp. NPDC127098]|uniref:hypothetical protein n=1 Tax=Streptomyces sp. NPDC127098 TaxID=3347137 RepID=UPI003668F8EC